MFCQKCGKENDDSAKFCNSCGTNLKPAPEPQPSATPKTCKSCGTDIRPGELFCSKCLVRVPDGDSSANPIIPPVKKEHGILYWSALCIGILLIMIIGSAIIVAFSNGITGATTPPTAKDSIKVSDASWSVRTNVFDSTRTYTVVGTFTNTGSQSYTFFGGLTLVDADYNKLDYKGETMTLAPGQSKTLTEVFRLDISSSQPTRIAYKVN